MGIFVPIWKTANKRKTDKAVAAVKNISDQLILRRIAAEAPLPRVQEAAMKQISDTEILSDIAINGLEQAAVFRRYFWSDYAVLKINDLDNLSKIAANAIFSVSDNAIDQIIKLYNVQSQTILKTIFLETQRPQIFQATYLNTVNSKYEHELGQRLWKRFTLQTASEIAAVLEIPAEDMCKCVKVHCNAPGPVETEIEEDFDVGFTEHETIYCLLCGRAVKHRSRPTAIGGKWSRWFDLQP